MYTFQCESDSAHLRMHYGYHADFEHLDPFHFCPEGSQPTWRRGHASRRFGGAWCTVSSDARGHAPLPHRSCTECPDTPLRVAAAAAGRQSQAKGGRAGGEGVAD